jgi:hypothetical protein
LSTSLYVIISELIRLSTDVFIDAQGGNYLAQAFETVFKQYEEIKNEFDKPTRPEFAEYFYHLFPAANEASIKYHGSSELTYYHI